LHPVDVEGEGMSFALYIVGFVVLITGMALGAQLLNVPRDWILVGVIIMAGIGILTGASIVRRPDPN
jgi:hypothetical protein